MSEAHSRPRLDWREERQVRDLLRDLDNERAERPWFRHQPEAQAIFEDGPFLELG